MDPVILTASVVRQKSTEDGTPGKLTVTDVVLAKDIFSCDTLELAWLNNQNTISCIVADSYRASFGYSEHLGSKTSSIVTREDGTTFDLQHGIYRLEDKHGRSACLLHNANFAGEVDHGEYTELHGCTALGYGYGKIQRYDAAGQGKLQFGILHTVTALEDLIKATKGRPLFVTYSWADGCAPADLTDVHAQA